MLSDVVSKFRIVTISRAYSELFIIHRKQTDSSCGFSHDRLVILHYLNKCCWHGAIGVTVLEVRAFDILLTLTSVGN
jgi:hypothetical protein